MNRHQRLSLIIAGVFSHPHAIVKNPLHSESASGSLGEVTYRRSRGQNVVSAKSHPSNPNTQKQQNAREVFSLGSDFIVWMNGTTVKGAGETQTPKEYLNGIKVAPETWSSGYLRRGFPNNYTGLEAARERWAGLGAGAQQTWEDANNALVRPFVARNARNGTAQYSGGEQYFLFQTSLFDAGYLAAQPGEAPIAFA